MEDNKQFKILLCIILLMVSFFMIPMIYTKKTNKNLPSFISAWQEEHPLYYYDTEQLPADSESAKSIIFHITLLSDAIEKMGSITMIPGERDRYVNSICDMQLIFDDITNELTKIKSKYTDNNLNKLIHLSKIESDYCKDLARTKYWGQQNKQDDALSSAQLFARVRKEVSEFSTLSLTLVNTLKESIDNDERQAFKDYLKNKYKEKIDSFGYKYSKCNNVNEVYMLPTEWAIIYIYSNII